MKRKAQFSTYLKPIIGIIFVLLLIMIVQQVLTFQASSEQQEQEVTFVQNVPKTFQQIANCLQSDRTRGNRYLLSSDRLDRYDTEFNNREPPCAEDFKYGYNVTVTPDLILLNSSDVEGTAELKASLSASNDEIVVAIDRSASMSGNKLATAKEAVNSFILSQLGTNPSTGNNEIGLVSFADEAEQEHDFTRDAASLSRSVISLEAGGGTDLAAGLQEAYDMGPDRIILITDGGKTRTSRVQDAIESGTPVHGIMYGNDVDTEIMGDITGETCYKRSIENRDGGDCWWRNIGAANRSRSEVIEGLRDYYSDSTVDTIRDAEYTFGQQNSSTGQSLRERLTLNYPVSIRYRPDLVLPATLHIEYRDGELEFFAGFLDKVIKQETNQPGNFFSARFQYSNSQEICSTDHQICIAGAENACARLQQPSSAEVDIEPFHLQPGRYALTANYSNTANTLYVNGGQDGGCNR